MSWQLSQLQLLAVAGECCWVLCMLLQQRLLLILHSSVASLAGVLLSCCKRAWKRAWSLLHICGLICDGLHPVSSGSCGKEFRLSCNITAAVCMSRGVCGVCAASVCSVGVRCCAAHSGVWSRCEAGV
jgi:hypothetical protein